MQENSFPKGQGQPPNQISANPFNRASNTVNIFSNPNPSAQIFSQNVALQQPINSNAGAFLPSQLPNSSGLLDSVMNITTAPPLNPIANPPPNLQPVSLPNQIPNPPPSMVSTPIFPNTGTNGQSVNIFSGQTQTQPSTLPVTHTAAQIAQPSTVVPTTSNPVQPASINLLGNSNPEQKKP